MCDRITAHCSKLTTSIVCTNLGLCTVWPVPGVPPGLPRDLYLQVGPVLLLAGVGVGVGGLHRPVLVRQTHRPRQPGHGGSHS